MCSAVLYVLVLDCCKVKLRLIYGGKLTFIYLGLLVSSRWSCTRNVYSEGKLQWGQVKLKGCQLWKGGFHFLQLFGCNRLFKLTRLIQSCFCVKINCQCMMDERMFFFWCAFSSLLIGNLLINKQFWGYWQLLATFMVQSLLKAWLRFDNQSIYLKWQYIDHLFCYLFCM